jgi:hypothetical protein
MIHTTAGPIDQSQHSIKFSIEFFWIFDIYMYDSGMCLSMSEVFMVSMVVDTLPDIYKPLLKLSHKGLHCNSLHLMSSLGCPVILAVYWNEKLSDNSSKS